MSLEPLAQQVLDFWFGSDYDKSAGTPKEISQRWFKKDAAFDRLIEQKFGQHMEAASWGAFDLWSLNEEGLAALIVLLDQFPRNLYRQHPRSFYFDLKAITFAKQAYDRKVHEKLPNTYAYFCFMPFMHCENLDAQNLGLEAFQKLVNVASEANKGMMESALKYAHAHQKIIAQFGRFPHRNEVLGRESTAEEIAFLKTPGSSF